MRVVLHCDADAFFVQVEVLRDPGLIGKPIAIQQHQDIIAANHAAKQAGVKKHMAPKEARAILSKVGGQVVHVFCEDGFRVSYRPYREVSGALIRSEAQNMLNTQRRLMKTFPAASVVERASIDEAFILLHGQAPDDNTPTASQERHHLLSQGLHLAHQVRAAAKAELGITLSVGVSYNKLLAKLSSRGAKPDGVLVVGPGSPELEHILKTTPIDRLPGMGGKTTAILQQAGVSTTGQLRTLLQQGAGNSVATLTAMGIPGPKAANLEQYSRGVDMSQVQDKGPPKSFQVQMTLTPVPIPAPPIFNHLKNSSSYPRAQTSITPSNPAAAAAAAAGTSSSIAADDEPVSIDVSGLDISSMTLQPLPVQGPSTRQRLSGLLSNMCKDLVARVVLDRHQEGRWPRKLILQLGVQSQHHTGPVTATSDAHIVSRSATFPSAALLHEKQKHGTSNAVSTFKEPTTEIDAQDEQHVMHWQGFSGHYVAQQGYNSVAGNRDQGPQRTELPEQNRAAAGGASHFIVSERTFAAGAAAGSPGTQKSTSSRTAASMQQEPRLVVQEPHLIFQGCHPSSSGSANSGVSDRLAISSASGGAPGNTGAVHEAVHVVVEGLAMSILQQQPGHWVVTTVSLTATNMVSVEKASAPTITRFLTKPQTKSQANSNSQTKAATATTAAAAAKPISGAQNTTVVLDSLVHGKLSKQQQQCIQMTQSRAHKELSSSTGSLQQPRSPPSHDDVALVGTCPNQHSWMHAKGTHSSASLVGQQPAVSDKPLVSLSKLGKRQAKVDLTYVNIDDGSSRVCSGWHGGSKACTHRDQDDDAELILLVSSPKRQKRCDDECAGAMHDDAQPDPYETLEVLDDARCDVQVASAQQVHSRSAVTHNTGMRLTSLFDQLTADGL